MEKACKHNWKQKKFEQLSYNFKQDTKFFSVFSVCKRCGKTKEEVIKSE